MKINIAWLDDENDCETCGGSYAEGAVVTFEDGTEIEFIPQAHCFNTVSYEREAIYHRILEHLGHDVTYNY